MPAGHGLRSRTKDLFSRDFRNKGYIPLSAYLKTYKIGDLVPSTRVCPTSTFYHSRTGRVWNVTKRAMGVDDIKKQVGNRIIRKRIHVQPSRCTEDRVPFEEGEERMIDQLKGEANAKGEVISTKRQPKGPRQRLAV